MENIIQINEEQIKNQLGELVQGTVEDTLNSLLDKEADELCAAQKHERTLDRKNYRSGHLACGAHNTRHAGGLLASRANGFSGRLGNSA